MAQALLPMPFMASPRNRARPGVAVLLGRWVLLHLFQIALLDLLHHGLTAEQISFELRGNLAGHGEELVSDHLRKRDWPASGNQVRAPLEHQSGVPKNKASQKNARRCESRAAFSKAARETVQKNGEPQDKKRGERDKKAAAIRRDA